MKTKEIKITGTVLSQEIGRSWPAFLVKCLLRKKSVFEKNHRAAVKGAESELMSSLSLVIAVYSELQVKLGREKALEIMRKIIIPIGYNKVLKLLQPLRSVHKDPMELLVSYLELVDQKGVGRFAEREMNHDGNTCHRVVTKCPFYGFFAEAGTPEITGLFCEVDNEFYSKEFPEFRFHRNGSWENTIAYGKDHCEFVFERKTKVDCHQRSGLHNISLTALSERKGIDC
jgi:hypothetical protein